MQAKPAIRLPQRTCIACRSTDGKRQFVRLVRLPAGGVEIDATGKKAGRGAYICRQASCWQAALKKGRIDAALKTKLAPEDRRRLEEYATTVEAVPV